MAGAVPELLILNKLDAAEAIAVDRLRQLYPAAVGISALDGVGLEDLGSAIATAVAKRYEEVRLRVPYDRGDILAAVHRDGEVIAEEHTESGTEVVVRLPADVAAQLSDYVRDG